MPVWLPELLVVWTAGEQNYSPFHARGLTACTLRERPWEGQGRAQECRAPHRQRLLCVRVSQAVRVRAPAEEGVRVAERQCEEESLEVRAVPCGGRQAARPIRVVALSSVQDACRAPWEDSGHAFEELKHRQGVRARAMEFRKGTNTQVLESKKGGECMCHGL